MVLVFLVLGAFMKYAPLLLALMGIVLGLAGMIFCLFCRKVKEPVEGFGFSLGLVASIILFYFILE